MSNATQGKFGMFEMECAAYTILAHQKKTKRDIKGPYSPIGVIHFESDGQITGFLELIYGGFLGKQSQGDFESQYNNYTYNGNFVPTKEFIARLTDDDLAIAGWEKWSMGKVDLAARLGLCTADLMDECNPNESRNSKD